MTVTRVRIFHESAVYDAVRFFAITYLLMVATRSNSDVYIDHFTGASYQCNIFFSRFYEDTGLWGVRRTSKQVRGKSRLLYDARSR